MLKSPKRQSNCKEDHENKIIIEKWMKRNSSNKVIIGQNIDKLNSSNEKPKNTSTCDIKVSESKKVVIPIEISENKTNKLTNIKRVHSFPTDNGEHNTPKTKIFRQSLPYKDAAVSTFKKTLSANSMCTTPKLPNKTKPRIEIIPTKATSNISPKLSPKSTKVPNEPIPVIEVIKTTNNIIDNELHNFSSTISKSNVTKSTSTAKGNPVVKQVSSSVGKSNVIEISQAAKGNQIVKHLSPPTVKCNVIKTSKTKVGLTTSQNNVGIQNSVINDLFKAKDEEKKKKEDVYICLLENYRYLVIPKGWLVNEFTNKMKTRYIVFFHNQVVEEKDILISVVNKSLIIDKGGKMNYSVHGLPIETEGTILPKTLDNTKKLLSILHIFDKMQVCQGLGSDLNVVQNSVIFKDCCQYWRHKNCKIILIKAIQCTQCIKARNVLKSRSEPQPSIVKQEIEFVDVSVKTEDTFDCSE